LFVQSEEIRKVGKLLMEIRTEKLEDRLRS
jgi:hypothetical protein